MEDAFESGVTGLQWVVDAYTIVFASLIPTRAFLPIAGARRVFIAGTHIALYLSTALLVLGFGVALRYVSVGNRVGIAKQAAEPVVSR